MFWIMLNVRKKTDVGMDFDHGPSSLGYNTFDPKIETEHLSWEQMVTQYENSPHILLGLV